MAKPSATEALRDVEYDDDTFRLFFGTEPQDEIDFIETFLTVDAVQGGIVDFNLFPQQKLMAKNKSGRDITVKGRQTRASSFLLARNFRRMATSEGIKCLVMTQDDATTQTFRERIQHHIRDMARNDYKLNIGLDNDDELVFKDTESRYMFGSGEARVKGRAYTGHIVHLSELAHWAPQNVGSLLGSILPSVPGPPFGQLDIESTPNGAEGAFHDLVQKSKTYDPDSRYSAHFYPWWYEPRYRAGTTLDCGIVKTDIEWEMLTTNFAPSEAEEKLMDEHGLDMGQMIWRRITKKEQDATDAPFLQEYPETLEGCFLTAGGNYFATQDGINHLERFQHMVSPSKEILESLPYKGSNVSFQGPNLMIWQRPMPGIPYVAWVDCAGGGLDEDSDSSAILVMDALHGIIVARLNLKVAPNELAPMAVAISVYYSNALLGGERDALGSTCLSRIQELGYTNLWYYIDPAKAVSIRKGPDTPWGHPTQIRDRILTALRERVFSNRFHTSDGLLIQQMGSFTWQKSVGKREQLKAQAKKGQHDDLVMCAAGCSFIAPQAAAVYNAKYGREKNQIIIVGDHGLVRGRRNSGVQPKKWLR